MKKFLFKLFLVLIVFFVNLSVFCAEKIVLKECEYTEEFKRYQKLSEKEKENVIMPEICKSKESVLLKGSINTSLGANITDSKFDLRDLNKVTSVKNQESTNACWAFSTAASIESNLLVKTNTIYDLSEGHMEMSTQNIYAPSYKTFLREADEGGNYLISSAYLLNYHGPVKEEVFKFEDYKNILNESLEYSDELKDKLSNAKPDISVNAISQYDSSDGTCNPMIKSIIKKYLIENGAISSMIYSEADYYKDSYYYYNGEKNSTHAVTIVGWDDNISASNFKTTPNTNGAWIVKNSYGTDRYDNGYIYVSYADSNICESLTGFHDVSTDINDYIYYNDELGASGNYILDSSDSEIYAASVYSKKDKNKSEQLKRIVFASPSQNMEYEIYFSPTGELNKFQKVASGSTIARGYENVNLNNVYITNNKFAVAVKYTDDLPVYANATGTIFYGQEFTEKVSYISTTGVNEGYVDTSLSEFVVSVKAYTDAIDDSEIHSTTPSSTSSSISATSTKVEDDDNDDEEENSIEIIENENNEESYIVKENDVVNPKTTDISVDFSLILMIAILGVIALSALKLKNIKN